jgi:hypothetical protein
MRFTPPKPRAVQEGAAAADKLIETLAESGAYGAGAIAALHEEPWLAKLRAACRMDAIASIATSAFQGAERVRAERRAAAGRQQDSTRSQISANRAASIRADAECWDKPVPKKVLVGVLAERHQVSQWTVRRALKGRK